MLLLLTGASAVGKTTVRLRLLQALPANVEAHELSTLMPAWQDPTLAWRQEVVEGAVRRAVALQERGHHLLLAGDPVAPGEVVAAPSFSRLGGFAACLLDVQPPAHRQRLAQRAEDESRWPHHLHFAEWLRGHNRDPQHLPSVIRQGGWAEMRWDRWASWRAGDPRWQFASIDSSELTTDQVAQAVLAWCLRELDRRGPGAESSEPG